MSALAELAEAIEKLIKEVKLLKQAASKPPRQAWKPREVAEQLGMRDVETVHDLIRSGKLGAIKINGYYSVPDAELKRFLAPGIKQSA